MRMHCTLGISTIVGLLTIFHGFAEASDRSPPRQLTSAELDRVVAGAFVSAVGDGSAQGETSRSEAGLSIYARTGEQSYNALVGHVTSSATSNAGSVATASSNLSLTVILP